MEMNEATGDKVSIKGSKDYELECQAVFGVPHMVETSQESKSRSSWKLRE